MKKLLFVLCAVTVGFSACKKGSLTDATTQATFSTNIVTGHDPLENDVIQLTNTTTGNNSYYWDFGNGTTSTEMNPSVSYAMHGIYTVKLSITDSKGVTTTTSHDVNILCRFKNGIHPAVVQ